MTLTITKKSTMTSTIIEVAPTTTIGKEIMTRRITKVMMTGTGALVIPTKMTTTDIMENTETTNPSRTTSAIGTTVDKETTIPFVASGNTRGALVPIEPQIPLTIASLAPMAMAVLSLNFA